MASLDEIFVKEFNQLVYNLKANNGYVNLYDIPIPDNIANTFVIERHDKVAISSIPDEYYGKLSNSEALLWNGGQLKRRKFDFKGEFMKDKNGNFIYNEVSLPNTCVAVISDTRIGVPLKYKPKEELQFVDTVQKNLSDGTRLIKYMYIIPRQYCYKLNQVALVLSWNKLKVYYAGIGLTLKNGHILYMYVIPYKPSSQQHNYRVLHCKTNIDFNSEICALRDYWLKTNYMFNPSLCALMDTVKGRENLAYQVLDGVLDDYIRFDPNKPMSIRTENDYEVGDADEF